MKLERLSDVKAEQPWNIPLISITFKVLKFERLSDVKLGQPANIPPIFVTFEVLKFFSSSDVNAEQPENILPIFFTSVVLRYWSPSMFVRALRYWNQDAVEVGLKSLNEASTTAFVVVVSGLILVPAHADI